MATEIKLRAERRAGELLAEMPKNKGTRGDGRPPLGGRDDRPPKDERQRLSDLGISKDESSRWQKLARMPEPARSAASSIRACRRGARRCGGLRRARALAT